MSDGVALDEPSEPPSCASGRASVCSRDLQSDAGTAFCGRKNFAPASLTGARCIFQFLLAGLTPRQRAHGPERLRLRQTLTGKI
jgi:hypothetical protein